MPDLCTKWVDVVDKCHAAMTIAGVRGSTAVLVGTYEHNLDAKGRLVLPAKFRAHFAESGKGFLSADDAGCVAVFKESDFNRLARELEALRGESAADEARARRIAARTFEIAFEGSQARIVIPEELRREFGLEGTVIVNGFFDRAEIWAPAAFAAQIAVAQPRKGA